MQMLVVMAGGFIGATARYGLGLWLYTDGFPWNTLIANLIGCFFLGWFLTFMSHRGRLHSKLSLLLGTGVAGSFTTFSAFSLETVQLLDGGFVLESIVYVGASVIGGLFLVYSGFKVAASLSRAGADAE